MKIPEIYRLETINDTHVGTGESGFGFIDNLIQRDSATGYPCFNSSGMKGAIKQHIDAYSSMPDKVPLMKKIFGSDATVNKGKQQETQQGESIYFAAHLLALPVRTNTVSYMLTTSPELIRFYEHFRKMLNKPVTSLYNDVNSLVNVEKPENGCCFSSIYKNLEVELDIVGTKLEYKENPDLLEKLKALFGADSDRICIVSDITMSELCSDMYLPVISRNALDDGESINLWYEQILPRFSVLYFGNLWQDKDQRNFVEEGLISTAEKPNYPLQVGANASVSYGFTYITKIE